MQITCIKEQNKKKDAKFSLFFNEKRRSTYLLSILIASQTHWTSEQVRCSDLIDVIIQSQVLSILE